MPRRSGFAILWWFAALVCAGMGLVAQCATADPCSATHQFDTVGIPADSGATMVRSTDLDGDGLLDLVVIRGGQGKFEALRHGTGPTYTSLGSHSWTSPILRAILGDFDADGHPDLAFTDDASHVVIFRGGGDGSFAFGTSVDLGAPVFDLVSADLDGDGHAEIVVSQPTNSRVTTLRWTSAPFGYVLKTNSYSNTLPDPYFLAIGKIDSDTRFDLIASRRASARAFLLRGSAASATADGTFSLSTSLSLSAIMTTLTLSDVDLDGVVDLIYGCLGRVIWNYGVGGGTFTGGFVVLVPGLVTDILVTDVNRDLLPDLLCAVPSANLVAQINGGGARTYVRGPDCSPGIAPLSLACSPVDRRRLSDFVAAARASNGLALLQNTCDISVVTPPPPPDLGPPVPIVPPPDPPPDVEVAPTPPPAALPDPGPLPAASAWPLEGVVVCSAPGNQTEFQAVDDFAYGAYFAWVDERNGEKDIYAVRLDASGHVVPGWTANGTPVCRAGGAQSNLHCFTDGKWGVWLTWSDLRSGIPSLYLQKLTPEGQLFPGWPADGLRFCADTVAGYVAATDRRGGMQIVWSKFTGGWRWSYMQHLGPGGQPYGVWPVCGNLLYQDHATYSTCLDQSYSLGPAIPAWPDGIHYTIYNYNNCRPFASVPPSDCYWCVGIPYSLIGIGLALPHSGIPANLIADRGDAPESAPPPPVTNAYCGPIQLVDDGFGGYYVFDDCNQFYRYGGFPNPSWQVATGEFRDPLPAGENTFNLLRYDYASGQYRVARILNDGTWSPGFGSSGVVVAQSPSSGIDHIYRVTDGSGGMLIAWTDARVPGSWPATGQLYATWLRSDGTRGPGWRVDGNPIGNVSVPAELDFAVADRRGSAIVGWRDSREGEANLYASRVTVESPPSSEASALGPFKRVMTDAMRRTPAPASVTRELSFAGPRPNPAAGGAAVEFTLSRSGDVSIRVLDVAGRTVRTRELRGLAAGDHRVVLDEANALAPGIYVVELDAERKRLTRKLVMAR